MSSLVTSYEHLMQLTFTRYAGNPIIMHTGIPRHWKEWQVEESIVFADPQDASRLIMYYSGACASETGGAYIGRAVASLDDPFQWTDDPANPLLSPGAYPTAAAYIRLDSMLYLDGIYWMYVTGMSRAKMGDDGIWDPGHNYIHLARSHDGVHFEWHDAPILAPSEDEVDVSQAAVLKEGAQWYMYYCYRTPTRTLPGIRVATSSDGLHWQKQGEILTGMPGGYDAWYYEWHQILKLGADYVLLSECYDGAHWSVGVAHSTLPLSGWEKSARPLFTASGVPGAFDVHHVATPAIYDIGSQVMLFYQGGNNLENYIYSNWDIGVATAEVGV